MPLNKEPLGICCLHYRGVRRVRNTWLSTIGSIPSLDIIMQSQDTQSTISRSSLRIQGRCSCLSGQHVKILGCSLLGKAFSTHWLQQE